ncbi:FecCD family ABC transporter permease [Amycolatopsis sp. CA-230715]|uniref:FecCD family ABC transporter permease n=1 Tax=Amycolatopsis sp. CA-230715 TaxID=2745196 RepID=UPI001C01BB7B|nr:iron ABC transporter permease [Amycolatopsis sp. CA-230715]QWF77881.1 Vitamin B12 import system permease protein BtuC [Amycolatopsis sp. CA-230715]
MTATEAPPAEGASLRRTATPTWVLFAVGLAALVLSAGVATCVGTNGVGLPEVARAVGTHLGLPVEPLPRLLDSLIWQLRVPRVLLAALIGAMLAVSGTVLQGLTGNALADPYLLGVSNGASVGAVAVTLSGLGGTALGLSGGALVGALLSFGAMMLLLRGGMRTVRIVLTGVVVGQLFAALTSLLVMASANAETTRAITYWLLGSMTSARWDSVLLCAIACAVGLAGCWTRSQALDAFSFGEDTAESLGISVRATRIAALVLTALLTSVAVASVGAIGFVGLIVPHAARFVVGPRHRVLMPFAAVMGAVFLVWTDALARIAMAPREVPVGVVTALIGVPVFLLILRRRGEL